MVPYQCDHPQKNHPHRSADVLAVLEFQYITIRRVRVTMLRLLAGKFGLLDSPVE
jgi:hypothetical protein